jgi:hypothetical protein
MFFARVIFWLKSALFLHRFLMVVGRIKYHHAIIDFLFRVVYFCSKNHETAFLDVVACDSCEMTGNNNSNTATTMWSACTVQRTYHYLYLLVERNDSQEAVVVVASDRYIMIMGNGTKIGTKTGTADDCCWCCRLEECYKLTASCLFAVVVVAVATATIAAGDGLGNITTGNFSVFVFADVVSAVVSGLLVVAVVVVVVDDDGGASLVAVVSLLLT